MGTGSFYQKLIAGDWMGRCSKDYTYEKKGHAIGWEETLTEGEAFSSFLLKVESKKKHIDYPKQILLAKQACSNIMNRMLVGTNKPTRITFSNDFNNYAQGDMICVTLEPLKEDNTIKFPSFNHALDPILGYCAHEIAHILYTDDDYGNYILKFRGVEMQLKSTIMNLLEDERIEKLVAENYRGYTHYLGKAKDYCFGKKFQEQLRKTGGADNPEPINRLMELFIHLIRYPKALREEHVNEFEKEVLQFQQILTPFPTTIHELTLCTEEIYKVFLRFFQQQKQPQPQQGQGGEQEEEQEEQQQNQQQSKAKAQSGGGNTKSDKGDDSEEEEEQQSGSGKSEKQDKQDSDEDKQDENDGGSGDEDETEDEGSGKGSYGNGADADDKESDEEKEEKGSGKSGEPTDEETEDKEGGNGADGDEQEDSSDTDTDGDGDGEGDQDGNQPEEAPELTEEEIIDEMVEALGGIISALASSLPEGMSAEEVVDAFFKGQYGVEEALRSISDFDNSSMAMRKSDTHSYPALRNLHTSEMNVCFLDVDKHLSTDNHYDKALAEVRPFASSLRAELQKMNRNVEVTNTGLFEGSFDDGLLVDALIGRKNIYSETHKITNRGVCVVLLIDESGSMEYSQAWFHAQKIAVMFERALDGVNNTEFFCYGHTTGSDIGAGNRDATMINCYFEGRKKGKRQNLGKIYHHNTNRDGHAILETVARVRSQIEKDKPIVLFMISDGEPSASVPHGFSQKGYTKKCVDTVEKTMGATVIHVAIHKGIPSAEMFNQFVTFSDFRTLVRDIGGLLKKIVTDIQNPISI